MANIIKIGSKIYYELNTGNIILTVGEMQGYVKESTKEEDFANYEALKKYDKEAVGKIQLEYGELDKLLQENKANSYKVDVSGEEPKLVFSWIDYNTGKPAKKPKSEIEILKETVDSQNDEIKNLKSVVDFMLMSKAETSDGNDLPPIL